LEGRVLDEGKRKLEINVRLPSGDVIDAGTFQEGRVFSRLRRIDRGVNAVETLSGSRRPDLCKIYRPEPVAAKPLDQLFEPRTGGEELLFDLRLPGWPLRSLETATKDSSERHDASERVSCEQAESPLRPNGPGIELPAAREATGTDRRPPGESTPEPGGRRLEHPAGDQAAAGQLQCLVRRQAILRRAPDTKERRLQPHGVEASSWTTKDAERQLCVTEAVEASDALVATDDVLEDRSRLLPSRATHAG
jgi:hypothetical protein